MGWIKFDFDCGNAQVWYETSSEDGWVFDYDTEMKVFRVWNSCEHQTKGYGPAYICNNLDEVCRLVKGFA